MTRLSTLRTVPAVACRRLLSTTSGVSPTLLGHFHKPRPSGVNPEFEKIPTGSIFRRLKLPTNYSGIRFVPATPETKHIGLDFLPNPSWRFDISDSHLGLLLLHLRRARGSGFPGVLVCDPVSRLYALLPELPGEATEGDNVVVVGTAILSRAERPFEFDVLCLTVLATGQPRSWVATFRDNVKCSWRALPPSDEILLLSDDPYLMDSWCVHAAGGLYWHLAGRSDALALDPTTMAFGLPSLPTAPFTKYRVGETSDDMRLRCAALDIQKLRVYADDGRVAKGVVIKPDDPKVHKLDNNTGDAGAKSRHGWVLEREICLRQLFDTTPPFSDQPPVFWNLGGGLCLSDIDAGRTGKCFFQTSRLGRFTYDINTGEMERLVTEDGLEYGHPMFAYFTAEK